MTISHHEKGKKFGTAVYFCSSYTFTALIIVKDERQAALLRWISSLSRGRGDVVLEGGGDNFKTSPFLGVNFSLVRNMSGVKFYNTATTV